MFPFFWSHETFSKTASIPDPATTVINFLHKEVTFFGKQYYVPRDVNIPLIKDRLDLFLAFAKGIKKLTVCNIWY